VTFIIVVTVARANSNGSTAIQHLLSYSGEIGAFLGVGGSISSVGPILHPASFYGIEFPGANSSR
jgi:hypothetical protein